jgi:hypothetical protein
MRLEDTRRWHWMLIAPFVGLLIGFVRYQLDPSGVGDAESLDAKHDFEQRLVSVQKLQGGGERHYFDNVRVVKTLVNVGQDRSGRPKFEERYVVLGKNMMKSKRSKAPGDMDWTPTFVVTEDKFVPKMVKIKPDTAFPPPTVLDKLQVLAEKLKLKRADPPGTVLDYLKKLQVQEKITFKYEWWKQPRVSMAAWSVGSFIVIGLVWPTVINLIAFGSPFRPLEKKVAKAKSRPADASYKPKVTTGDMEELKRLGDEMERKLKEGASEGGVGVGSTDKPAESPVKPLAGTETVAAIQVADKDEPRKAFGTDGDDFYPTEVHGHARKDGE